MYSCIRNSEKYELDVALLNINSSLSKENEELVTSFAELFEVKFKIISVNSNFAPEFSNSKSLVVYGPLFALDVFENTFLWLDADTILLPGWTSIFQSLGDNSNKGNIIRAVRDSESTLQILKDAKSQSYEINSNRYFNSGVMILCPEMWRKFGYSLEWQEVAQNRKKFHFVFNDQDVLNYMINSNVSLLPKEFNEIAGTRTVDSSSKVIHFAGTPKPWNMTIKAKQIFLGHLGMRYSPSKLISRTVDFEIYWMYESEILTILRELGGNLYTNLLLKSQYEKQQLDFLGVFKHKLLQFTSRDFRNLH